MSLATPAAVLPAAENDRTLRDFALAQGPLAERAAAFSEYVRTGREEGLVLYEREILSAAGPRVLVRDAASGLPHEMVMFGSNNYLGLADEPAVHARTFELCRRYGTGLGGPPLLNGTTELHRELERRLAAWKGTEDCVLFPSGYQANLGWIVALARPGDIVLYDEHSHASFFDGLALVKGVRARPFPHGDTAALERLLTRERRGAAVGASIFVCAEGVYSMDGDTAPLDRIVPLAERAGALTVLDDAHGLGVLGARGAGTVEHFGLDGRVDVQIGTFSKALAVTGGFIACRRDLADYIRYFARSRVFSAALPPVVVAAALAGLEAIEREPARVERLRRNVERVVAGLRDLGLPVASRSAIIAVGVPAEVALRPLAREVHARGVFVNAVEYPAVPLDRQRFRVSVMSEHSESDIARLLEVFGDVVAPAVLAAC
jgi:glycine C-acetyltransferase